MFSDLFFLVACQLYVRASFVPTIFTEKRRLFNKKKPEIGSLSPDLSNVMQCPSDFKGLIFIPNASLNYKFKDVFYHYVAVLYQL